MKITVLIENLVYRKDLFAEHGLSIHIDTGSEKILFDTGQTGAFVDNANGLGIDLSEVDFLVISHGHYDHTGGISRFLDANSRAEIFISNRALNPKYKNDAYIGIQPDIDLPAERMHLVEEPFTLSKNVHILGYIETVNINDTHFRGFYEEQNSNIIPDNFIDELFICLETDKGIHIVSGCSHNGISNIHSKAKNHFVKPVVSIIGGFHLIGSNDMQIRDLAVYFNNEGIRRIYTGHCTGLNNYCLLKEYSNADIEYLYTASIVELL